MIVEQLTDRQEGCACLCVQHHPRRLIDTHHADPPHRSSGAPGMPKSKAEPVPEPPPRPQKVLLQVRCVPWKSMDFTIDARVAEYQVNHLEEIILARHGDPIENLKLYKGPPSEETLLTSGSTDTLQKVGEMTIFYDYYPPLDPFCNRPMAHTLYSTTPVITLPTYEGCSSKPTIEPEKLRRAPITCTPHAQSSSGGPSCRHRPHRLMPQLAARFLHPLMCRATRPRATP